MYNHGKVRSTQRPAELEVTDTSVFVASNVSAVIVEGMNSETQETHTEYEFDYVEYSKNEYVFMMYEEQKLQNDVLDYLLMGGE